MRGSAEPDCRHISNNWFEASRTSDSEFNIQIAFFLTMSFSVKELASRPDSPKLSRSPAFNNKIQLQMDDLRAQSFFTAISSHEEISHFACLLLSRIG